MKEKNLQLNTTKGSNFNSLNKKTTYDSIV